MATHNETLRNVFGTSVAATVARILSAYDASDDATKQAGANWYREAQMHADTLATRHNVSREHAASVIAQLSPQARWADNVAGAYALMAGEYVQRLTKGNIARAYVAYGSSDPLSTINGPKTRAFAANILGDTQRVTVDIWALRVALPPRLTGVSGHKWTRGTDDRKALDKGIARVGAYDAIAHCYRLAAKRRGVEPSVMQAVTWVVIRGNRKG